MKGWRVGLWVVQVLLAVVFTGAALMKLTQPYEALAASLTWVKLFSPETVKLIGIVELLGAIGLIVPAATRILPMLTPLAAAGLMLTMVGAGVTNIRIGEPPIVNVVLGGLAAFVAWAVQEDSHRSAKALIRRGGVAARVHQTAFWRTWAPAGSASNAANLLSWASGC